MAKSLNKVMILGNVGADPKISSTTNSNKVATFSVATTAEWKDQLGNKQSKTEWHHVVAWQWLADIVENYVKKGKQLYIEGHLQTRSYVDKNNIERQLTEIVASDIILLGNSGGSSQYGSQDFSGQQEQMNSMGGYSNNSGYQQQSGMNRNVVRNNSYVGNGSMQQQNVNSLRGNYNQQAQANNAVFANNGMQQQNVNQLAQNQGMYGNNSGMNNAPSIAGISNQAVINNQSNGFSQNRSMMNSQVNNQQGLGNQIQPNPMQNSLPSNANSEVLNGSINQEEDIPF